MREAVCARACVQNSRLFALRHWFTPAFATNLIRWAPSLLYACYRAGRSSCLGNQGATTRWPFCGGRCITLNHDAPIGKRVVADPKGTRESTMMSPPPRGPWPPKVRGPGHFGAGVPGSGPIWRWGPGVPAVSVFRSACGVSMPKCLSACWCVVTN